MDVGKFLLDWCRKRKEFWGKNIRGCDADGDDHEVYLERHFLVKIPKPRKKGSTEEPDTLFGIYLHHFLKSDTDRAPHDHPWPFMTIILSGGYWENQLNGRFWRKPGTISVRSPKHIHWVELPKKVSADVSTTWDTTLTEIPAITLFFVGPQVREWGFWMKEGWKSWTEAFNLWGCK